MKKILGLSFLILAFLGLNANGGGVTVGNGQGRTIVGLSLKKNFKTEFDLTKYANQVITAIGQKGFKRIIKMKKAGECSHDYTQVKDLNIQSFFPILDGELTLEKEYVGYLKVELKDCKKSEKISSDTPYGGADLWDMN
jgi:hypothetical protein